MSERPTVWGIPCPWSGDERDPIRWPYRAWFWLYANNQRVRHLIGLHQKPRANSIAPRCDWCGHRNVKQRAIADRNRLATTHPAPAATRPEATTTDGETL